MTRRPTVQGALAGVVLMAGLALAGCIDDADASVATRNAPADVDGGVVGPDAAGEEPYTWEGSTPVDVFVCTAVTSCQGHIVEATEWRTQLPFGDAITGVAVSLTWDPVDATIGPMVFRMDRLDASGVEVENLAHLVQPAGPISMVVENVTLAPGESAQFTVWPEAKIGGPAPVFVDLAEQPFRVTGALSIAA